MDEKTKPSGDLVRVRRPATQVEARSMAIFLEGRGIPAVVSENNALQLSPVFFSSSPYALSPEVFVNREDQVTAEAALLEFEALTRRADEITPDPKEEFDEPHVAWQEWPRCPECSCRRISECPDCGEASEDFSLSEFQEDEEPIALTKPKRSTEEDDDSEDGENDSAATVEHPYLSCQHCGETFRPKFYRRCANCTHVFPDGIALTPVEPKKKLRWVPIVIVIGLIAIVVSLAIAFQIRMQFQADR